MRVGVGDGEGVGVGDGEGLTLTLGLKHRDRLHAACKYIPKLLHTIKMRPTANKLKDMRRWSRTVILLMRGIFLRASKMRIRPTRIRKIKGYLKSWLKSI